jgi:hypothetical protein
MHKVKTRNRLDLIDCRGVPGPTSKFVAACPSQMGWRGMEHKWRNEPCIILHQGACSRGYKPCERARVRESEGESERERGSDPCSSSPAPLSCVRMLVCSYARPSILPPPLVLSCGALDTPFIDVRRCPTVQWGVAGS